MTHRTTSNFHCVHCGMLISFKDSHDTRKKRLQERLHAKVCKVKASDRQIAENEIEYSKFIAKQVSNMTKQIQNGFCKTESKGATTIMNAKSDTSVSKTFQTVVPTDRYETAVNHLYKSDDKFIQFVVDNFIADDTESEKLLIQNQTNGKTLESTYVFNWRSKKYGKDARFQMPCDLINYLFKSGSMPIQERLECGRQAIAEALHRQNCE